MKKMNIHVELMNVHMNIHSFFFIFFLGFDLLFDERERELVCARGLCGCGYSVL